MRLTTDEISENIIDLCKAVLDINHYCEDDCADCDHMLKMITRLQGYEQTEGRPIHD